MTKNPAAFRESYPCPYLPGKTFTQEAFLADHLNDAEWGVLLREGWRRFGTFFFRPVCQGCRECRPIRVLAAELTPTESQRRVLRRNRDTEVLFTDGTPDLSILALYNEHSAFRFGNKPVSEYEFSASFLRNGAPSFRSEYYVQGILAAVGFLDRSDTALSSVYFIYGQQFSHLSLGTYSVFAECKEAARLGLPHYHLGYWVKDNHFMAYKARFHPHELMDWETGEWRRQILDKTPLPDKAPAAEP